MHVPTTVMSMFVVFLMAPPGDATTDFPTMVSLDSPLCSFTRPTLRCDFRGAEQPVFLESNPVGDQGNGKGMVVFLENAKLLILNGDLCIDMVLRSIEQIIVMDSDDNGDSGDSGSCPHKKLRIRNVHMNSLPRGLSDIYMDSSTIDVFHPDGNKLQTLIVINSVIHQLNAKDDIYQGSIKVHSSKVHTIERLYVNTTNQVQFYKSVMNYIPENGVQLEYCSVDLTGSEITHYSNNSIIICNQRELLDDDFHGEYTCPEKK
ncbi:uncharacterized protein LOC122262670 [Penaeus japonicus]|uniref:uncharacterized protein LOC122262670 n=1 Tax=Penaeus japonicus TaxID=27405 RepID=UPI001C713FB3|nr:uncharacterized protein LOC122262670 [Penaeus japonicus]